MSSEVYAPIKHAETGAQTHRSWWVAKDFVRNIAKADGRATLKLDHAIEAPVSRSFLRLWSAAKLNLSINPAIKICIWGMPFSQRDENLTIPETQF